MGGTNGPAVAKKLKEIKPKINIIFLTAHSEYARDAFELFPSGYILKPVTSEALERAFMNLRYPVDPKTSARPYLRHLNDDLRRTLKEAGADDAIIKQRGSIAVVPEKIVFD